MENMANSNGGVLVSKVPMLKPNEFDMWKIRIRQYILLTHYSMWDIIENGTTSEGIGADGKRPPPKTDGKRKVRQSKMKALSTLLLAIPNEYQHQFHKCADVKILWEALEKRFSCTKGKRAQRETRRIFLDNNMRIYWLKRMRQWLKPLIVDGVKWMESQHNRVQSTSFTPTRNPSKRFPKF